MGREPSRPPNAGEWRAVAAMSSLAESVLAIDNAFTLALSRFSVKRCRPSPCGR